MKRIVKIIVILLAIVYISKLAVTTFANKDKVTVVTYGNLVEEFNTQGYIIRNEMVINSPFDGKIKKLVSSGVRVAKGTPIAQIYSADFDEKKLQELEDVTKELKTQDTNIPFYSDIQKLDDMIKKEEENCQNMLKENNSGADKIKKRIEALKAKKEQILSKGPLVLQKIENLKEQKDYLEKYVEKNMITINSPEAGIVSYYFDGFEHIFNEKNMFNLNVRKLKNVDSQPKEVETEIKKDYPFIKVIGNLEWHLAVILNEREEKLLKENSNVKILIENYDYELRGKVIKTYKGDDKLYIGIIDMIDSYQDFYKETKVRVKIILNDYRGLKVPLSAIVKKEGKTGVFVIKNNKYPVFKEVVVKAADDKYAIVESVDKISGLRLYDEIATNGEDYLSK
ncbi:membrane fusion protein [Thermoanaerobacter kivui]|uniref:Membrane fusion protein n=1 Tax=Thermoanaerobacter kivui TaxID=2325 RepID=A0A097AS64_THEKI|nr:HlyD family efflux transporter periplasmic adaptor subunit [Thermoanaerobacter kivui]AIS52666.1 membrane fusion protein [Thermoanaerobacter kivui]